MRIPARQSKILYVRIRKSPIFYASSAPSRSAESYTMQPHGRHPRATATTPGREYWKIVSDRWDVGVERQSRSHQNAFTFYNMITRAVDR